MEKAIDCVAFFYKAGSSIKDFPRKKIGILVKERYYSHVTQRWSSVSYDFIYFSI